MHDGSYGKKQWINAINIISKFTVPIVWSDTIWGKHCQQRTNLSSLGHDGKYTNNKQKIFQNDHRATTQLDGDKREATRRWTFKSYWKEIWLNCISVNYYSEYKWPDTSLNHGLKGTYTTALHNINTNK